MDDSWFPEIIGAIW